MNKVEVGAAESGERRVFRDGNVRMEYADLSALRTSVVIVLAEGAVFVTVVRVPVSEVKYAEQEGRDERTYDYERYGVSQWSRTW